MSKSQELTLTVSEMEAEAQRRAEKRKNETSEPIVAKMALEKYWEIELEESTDPKVKFGSLYIGLNEYSHFLPRETPMLLAQSLVNQLDWANKPTFYIDADGKQRTQRRDDVRITSKNGPFSPEEAHVKRLAGFPVFPTKLPQPVLIELDARVEKQKKKG